MASFTDFIAGKMDGVALSRDGRHITMAPQLGHSVQFWASPVIWERGSGILRRRAPSTPPRDIGDASIASTAKAPATVDLDGGPGFYGSFRARREPAGGDVYAASSPNGKIYQDSRRAGH